MTFFRGVLDLGKMGDLMKECTVHSRSDVHDILRLHDQEVFGCATRRVLFPPLRRQGAHYLEKAHACGHEVHKVVPKPDLTHFANLVWSITYRQGMICKT